MRCCASHRNGGHLSYRQPIRLKRFADRSCDEYREWLHVQRGLAKTSIRALMWEGRNFLSWFNARRTSNDLAELNIGEIDTYFEMRAGAGLSRRSLKDVAERLAQWCVFSVNCFGRSTTIILAALSPG